MQKTVSFRPKQDAVKQEVDRNEDMVRSALRAIASLNRIRYVYFSPFPLIWEFHTDNCSFCFLHNFSLLDCFLKLTQAPGFVLLGTCHFIFLFKILSQKVDELWLGPVSCATFKLAVIRISCKRGVWLFWFISLKFE